MLDVSEMKDESDYLKVLTKSGRKSYRSKIKKFENEPNIEYERSDFNGTDEEIDRVWTLYKATGDKVRGSFSSCSLIRPAQENQSNLLICS